MKQKTMFSEVLSSVTKYFLILVILVMVGIFCSGIRVVETGNVALILRFGKLVGDTPEEQIHKPGLLLAFPYIIDEVIIVPTDAVMEQTVTTYYTDESNPEAQTADGAYLITGDQGIAVMSASVKYVVSDPVAYALNVKDIGAIINGCVSNALLSTAASADVDVLLTTGKDAFTTQAIAAATQRLNAVGAGVQLTTLELTQVAMAKEVRDIYDQVNAAAISAETTVQNAKNYVTTLIPYAEGVKAENISTANSAYLTAVAEAKKDLTEFNGLLDEFLINPELVKVRVYSNKVAQILSAIGTIRVVQDGESIIYLNP